jgi:hypothetical protein
MGDHTAVGSVLCRRRTAPPISELLPIGVPADNSERDPACRVRADGDSVTNCNCVYVSADCTN